MLLYYLVLYAGIIAASSAVIIIKASQENPVLLAAYRVLIAALVLIPFFLRDLQKFRMVYSLKHVLKTILPGIVLGLHFIFWNIGARLTLAANAQSVIAMTPIVMPFFLYYLMKEKLTKGELSGTLVSLVGFCVLAVSDFHFGKDSFIGDTICFLSMLFFTCYLALGRKSRDFPSVWLYVVPLYFTAGLLCFAASLFFLSPFKPYPLREILLILGLGFIPTVIGHSIFNYSMRHLRGQLVALSVLTQFIFAGIFAYVFLGEIPRTSFYCAAPLMIGGAAIAVLATPPGDKPQDTIN